MNAEVPQSFSGSGTFALYERELVQGNEIQVNRKARETMGLEDGSNDIGAQQGKASGGQVTAGMVAKSLLAWADAQGIQITQKKVKDFVNRMWPTISGHELLTRSRKIFYLCSQLEANGWLESEEAQSFKAFDTKMQEYANEGVPIPLQDMTIQQSTGNN